MRNRWDNIHKCVFKMLKLPWSVVLPALQVHKHMSVCVSLKDCYKRMTFSHNLYDKFIYTCEKSRERKKTKQ